jgi:hypothetical protein
LGISMGTSLHIVPGGAGIIHVGPASPYWKICAQEERE